MFKRRKLLKEPENFEKAYEYAVFLLSLRLRTTGEIEHKMKERGFAQPVIQNHFGLFIPIKMLSTFDAILLAGVIVTSLLAGCFPAMKAYRKSLADGLTIKL